MAKTQKLTSGQLSVLRACARPEGTHLGEAYSRLWRNFDQLERRCLIEQIGVVYITTAAGNDLLARFARGEA